MDPHQHPRRRARVVALVAVAGVVAVVALALLQPWRLLTRQTVDEALPVAAAAPAATSSAASPATSAATAPDSSAPSATRAPATRTLASGRFTDGAHPTSGTARLLVLADGRQYLRLEGFSTSDGPDVHVWLTDQDAAADPSRFDDGRVVALGRLKGTDGNQNYELPRGTRPEDLRSVVIWCDRFDVAFGAAALRPVA